MLSPTHFVTLAKYAQRLRLNSSDALKYILAYYIGRLCTRLHLHPRPVFALSLRDDQGIQRRCFVRAGTDCHVIAEIYCDHPYAYAKRLTAVNTILDLGANIGASALYLTSSCPNAQIACVEPVPGNADILRRTLAANNVHSTVFEAAIGPSDGTVEVQVEDIASMCSVTPRTTTAKTIQVRQLTVDEVMEHMHWERIDLLKVDIEGYEYTLFTRNANWLERVDAVIGELHCHTGYSPDALTKDFAKYGLTITNVRTSGDGEMLFEAIRHD